MKNFSPITNLQSQLFEDAGQNCINFNIYIFILHFQKSIKSQISYLY